MIILSCISYVGVLPGDKIDTIKKEKRSKVVEALPGARTAVWGRLGACPWHSLRGHFSVGARAPVSRLFEIPIQISFSGLKNLPRKPFPREGPCTDVGGYMRESGQVGACEASPHRSAPFGGVQRCGLGPRGLSSQRIWRRAALRVRPSWPAAAHLQPDGWDLWQRRRPERRAP